MPQTNTFYSQYSQNSWFSIMLIIPAINCSDLECVRDRLSVVKSQLPDAPWLHIDVSDGEFNSGNLLVAGSSARKRGSSLSRFTRSTPPVKTFDYLKHWPNIKGWLSARSAGGPGADIEVHLMVARPEKYVPGWLEMGAKRVIVHLESFLSPPKVGGVRGGIGPEVTPPNLPYTRGENESETDPLVQIFNLCAERGADAMLASSPETDVSEVIPYLDDFTQVQVLAVTPGPSGQEFNESALHKIRYLRERAPDLLIEVDGGINPETLREAKKAGADHAVAGSYVFNSPNPRKAYDDLLAAAELEE